MTCSGNRFCSSNWKILPWKLLLYLLGQVFCKPVCLVDDVCILILPVMLVYPYVEDCGVEGHFYWPIFVAECR